MKNKTRVFDILSYIVKSGSDMKGKTFSEATVKIKIGEITEHRVAEGNGPVNALDNAIRKALIPHSPRLEDVKLIDFGVKINNGDDGTGASVEVRMIFSGGTKNNWAASAISTDIIEASVNALIEGYKKAPLFLKKIPVLDEP
ncbi:MAG: alpha-isopropylmalate synthase regulatory domain-containing protein [bacterium]|nr:alpha-isopropylmalate synthase regulatory domain-containing protein [bacterium]